MANVKISDLPAASTPLSGTELVPIVQSGVTSQTTAVDVANTNDTILPALAANSGSSLVGFLQSGTGAVATTVQTKLQETVSVFDFMTAAEITAVQTNTWTTVTDVTAAVQAAFDTGHLIYFPNGTYKITTTLNITSPYQKFIGESRTSVNIVNTNNSVYAIQYLSPIQASTYDLRTGFVFDSLQITSKYGIKLNQSGTFATVFDKQGTLADIRVIHCSFIGTYSASVDPNFNTSVAPTEAELEGYGIGLRCAKMFDSLIQNCYFQAYGIGIYFDGCDINNIDTNRLVASARHIHLKANSGGGQNYGHQTKIQNNDILDNRRIGGIWDNCSFTSVKDNYFEVYSNSGQYYTLASGFGGLFTQNRLDATGSTTAIMSLAPSYGMIVSNNRLNPGAVASTIEVLSTNYTFGTANIDNNFLIRFTGNSGSFPTPIYPYCEYSYNDPRIFNYVNPKVLQGTQAAASFPFKKSTVAGYTDQWVIKTDHPTIFVYMPTQPQDFSFKVNFIGISLTATPPNGYVTIKWGGTSVYSGYLGFTSTTKPELKSTTITKPAGVAANSGLEIELVNDQVEYQAIELISS